MLHPLGCMIAGNFSAIKLLQRHSHEYMHMQLVEIVMDLGRPPLARFPSGDLKLADDVISLADLDHAISKVLCTTSFANVGGGCLTCCHILIQIHDRGWIGVH